MKTQGRLIASSLASESGDERVLTTVNCPGQGLGSGWRDGEGRDGGGRGEEFLPTPTCPQASACPASASLGAIHQDGRKRSFQEEQSMEDVCLSE